MTVADTWCADLGSGNVMAEGIASAPMLRVQQNQLLVEGSFSVEQELQQPQGLCVGQCMDPKLTLFL